MTDRSDARHEHRDTRRRRGAGRRPPRGLFAALVTSAMMRGVLHAAEATRAHAAAIRAGDQVGLVTLTLDNRVVWLPDAVSRPHATPQRIDLTDLTVGDALGIIFHLQLAS